MQTLNLMSHSCFIAPQVALMDDMTHLPISVTQVDPNSRFLNQFLDGLPDVYHSKPSYWKCYATILHTFNDYLRGRS